MNLGLKSEWLVIDSQGRLFLLESPDRDRHEAHWPSLTSQYALIFLAAFLFIPFENFFICY